MKSKCALFSLVLFFGGINLQLANAAEAPAAPANVKPKYGPQAELLSVSHQFMRQSVAPDYWALAPYYLGQQTDSACSLAVATTIVNAARSGKKLTSADELATQTGILKRLSDKTFETNVAQDGVGVTLEQMKTVLQRSLEAYGVRHFTIEFVHVNDVSPKTAAELHAKLVENEESAKNFIVANFNQGSFTGDTQVGHFAAVGAYDEKTKRVLVMDPDRQWYEPYWVSEKTFLSGMATKDNDSGLFRGYLWIKLDT